MALNHSAKTQQKQQVIDELSKIIGGNKMYDADIYSRGKICNPPAMMILTLRDVDFQEPSKPDEGNDS